MKLPRLEILQLLLFNGSRKVGFGLWLFGIGTFAFFKTRLDASNWMALIAMCAVLIGGGTVADAMIKKSVPIAPELPK